MDFVAHWFGEPYGAVVPRPDFFFVEGSMDNFATIWEPKGNTLWWTNSLLLKMAIEIVDFPINSMVIFHSKMLVHQRVTTNNNRMLLAIKSAEHGKIKKIIEGSKQCETTRLKVSDTGQHFFFSGCGTTMYFTGEIITSSLRPHWNHG